jgi:hypothetical protein
MQCTICGLKVDPKCACSFGRAAAQGATLTDERILEIYRAVPGLKVIGNANTVDDMHDRILLAFARALLAAAKPVSAPSIRTVINVGTGYVLDGVGALSAFNVKREASETDDSYRKRLLAKLDELELPI